MFSAAPAKASLVDTAISTGRPLRRWLLAAIVTGVSAMLWASLASVFPVQGAMTSASKSFFGPIGSTSSMVCSGSVPQISEARRMWLWAVPKRLQLLDGVCVAGENRDQTVLVRQSLHNGKNFMVGAE